MESVVSATVAMGDILQFTPKTLHSRRTHMGSTKKSQETGIKGNTIQITFKAGIDGAPGKDLEIHAYLFGSNGQLLTTVPAKDGVARVTVPDDQMRRARLFFAPKIPESRQKEKVTIADMERFNAYEPVWHFQSGEKAYELLPIPTEHWFWWLWCKCRVKGKVVKRIYSGGVTFDAPVSGAKVHICEVDRLPWLIMRLPDDVIHRLRFELKKVLEYPPHPIPEPDPWWHIDPGIIDPMPEVSRKTQLAHLQQVFGRNTTQTVMISPQPEPPDLSVLQKSITKTRTISALRGSNFINPQPEPPGSLLSSMPVEIRMALQSNATPVIRKALSENTYLLHPWLCLWDWLWPYFYRCDEVGVAITDSNGNFSDTISYLCFGDHPDLYFWVEYSIGGSWQTVYRPTVRCHTYWNYTCGSDVSITLTDPRVPGCPDTPTVYGNKVVVKTIGREVSMGEIYHSDEDPVKDGTVKEGWLHPLKNSPFGAILEPRVDFGEGLADAGITHYRWSYREFGSNEPNAWQVIDVPVLRHYEEITPDGHPPIYKSVQIGPDIDPDISGYYVKIFPELPPNAEDFEPLDEGFDLASAYFDTRGLNPGKYEMKLELFKKVGTSMQRVDFDGTDKVELYEITESAPLTMEEIIPTEPPPSRQLQESVGGNIHLFGYILVVHVDNRECYGTINAVTVSPGNMDLKCGFLEYGPAANATISFTASQPGDFAWFDFNVSRVSKLLAIAHAEDLVESSSVNGYIESSSTFTKSISVSSLFDEELEEDETACTRAAFAESLKVYALATNGYTRLKYLDAPRSEDPDQIRLRGFALTPEE